MSQISSRSGQPPEHDTENGHGQHGGHPPSHDHDHVNAPAARRRRIGLAVALVIIIVAAASLVQVHSGEATVITRFGNPVRVLLSPGIAWRWPMPFETAIPVDLRLRTTSSGLQDVGTRDGLRIIIQAYAVWQVQADPGHVERFMRAVQNQPDEAARQIRTFVGSALETTASGFPLDRLINTDPSRVQLADVEQRLRTQIEQPLRDSYGIRLISVGIERLTLPAVTLGATVDRMRAERETIATERTAEGKRKAAEIRSGAERDARIIQADALVKAATIEARSQVESADIYGKAYASSPELYNLLRSLDTLGTLVTPATRLVLRTDAAPFRVLVDGPPQLPGPVPAPLSPAPFTARPTAPNTKPRAPVPAVGSLTPGPALGAGPAAPGGGLQP